MKNQAIFSLKDKSKKLICHLLQSLFGALRVNPVFLLPKANCLVIVNASFKFLENIL